MAIQLLAVPSPNIHIHHEVTLPNYDSPLRISSNVPITIQRIKVDEALPGKIALSSNCATEDTTFLPSISINDNGITVEAVTTLSWLTPSWFRAVWSTNCRELQATSPATVVNAENVDSYCGTDWMDAYTECPLACPTGDECQALGEGYTCHPFTTCYGRIQSGAFDGMAGGNTGTESTISAGNTVGGQATTDTMSTELSGVSTAGTDVPTTLPPETIVQGSTQGSTVVNTPFVQATQAPVGNETETTNIPLGVTNETDTTTMPDTTVIATTAPPVGIITSAIATTDATTVSGDTPEPSTEANIMGTTTSESEAAMNNNETKPTIPPNYNNYKYPSYSPTASPQPSKWTYTPSYVPTSDARGYGLVVTLLALISIMIMFGFEGKVTVAVLAMASMPWMIHLRTYSTVEQSTKDTKECAYHVDVLVSACQMVHIDAPLIRVVDVDMGDVTSTSEDGCRSDNSADIVSKMDKLILMEGASTLETMC
jgi:hypothetical protein